MTDRVCGADGCPAGWLAVAMRPGAPGTAAAQVVPTAADLPRLGAPVAIDIPIGLMDRPEDGPRPVDRAARAWLVSRNGDGLTGVGSRVFAAPSRAHLAVLAEGGDYAALRRAFPPPRSLSKQCWAIACKIAELDALCRTDPEGPVWESHPEVAFARFAGRTLHPKKSFPGRAQRRALLAEAGFDLAALAGSLGPRTGRWAEDDLLDACVLALVAARIARGAHLTLPESGARDAHGVRMAIHV